MRLLHTGDWHLGKRLYGHDRLDEARAVLDEVARIAQAAEVDAILVAGDNLDRRLVDPASLAACLAALEALATTAPVAAITGNHEDPAFWAQIAPYLQPRIVLAAADATFTLTTRAGPLHVACLPWPEPAHVAVEPGGGRARSRARYAEAVGDRIAALADALRARRSGDGGPAVLLAHVMISHGLAGGGERELTLGGTYAVDGRTLPADLDYVALGHLHRAQPLPGYRGTGRFAGSTMTLDFSGDAPSPSVSIVDIREGRAVVTEVPLESGRRLVRLRGPLDRLAADAAAHRGAWFFCEVEVDALRLDLVRDVHERVPDALRVEPILPDAEGAADDSGAPPGDLVDAYAAWLRDQGRDADERLLTTFRALLARSGADGAA
jgi:exonuclease SbcD